MQNPHALRPLTPLEARQVVGGATISYGALAKGSASGKTQSQSANTYTRGCSTVTRCRR